MLHFCVLVRQRRRVAEGEQLLFLLKVPYKIWGWKSPILG